MRHSSCNKNIDCSYSREDGSWHIQISIEQESNKLKQIEIQLQKQPEESFMEREKLSAWIQDNKQKAGQLETQQRELTVREYECNEKELRQKAWEANLQAKEDETNKLKAIRTNTLVSQSSQTNEVGTKPDNASVQSNMSIPQYTQESEAEIGSINVNIAVQTNMSISKSSQACQVETCKNLHQSQTNQDAATRTTMDIPQSSQPSEMGTARPVQRKSHDKAVQVNILLSASTSTCEPHKHNWSQEIKKQILSTFVTNMTNCKRDFTTALYNAEVSELAHQ